MKTSVWYERKFTRDQEHRFEPEVVGAMVEVDIVGEDMKAEFARLLAEVETFVNVNVARMSGDDKPYNEYMAQMAHFDTPAVTKEEKVTCTPEGTGKNEEPPDCEIWFGQYSKGDMVSKSTRKTLEWLKNSDIYKNAQPDDPGDAWKLKQAVDFWLPRS